MFSKEELKRYNRHIILSEIGRSGQEKLKNAKVLVIGAGGLGCPVLLYLAAAGVGRIGVVDNDVVDISNLQRQVLYTTADLGKPKAEMARNHLLKINPEITIQAIPERFDTQNAPELIVHYDLIIDGTDNFATRFLINDACVIYNKPFVFGAIYKFEGQVSVFNMNGGPTYRCLVPEQPSQDDAPACSQIGVMGALPGIIGTMQAIEAIKLITGAGNVLSGKLFLFNAFTFESNIITFERNYEYPKGFALGNYDEACADNGAYKMVKTIQAADLKQRIEKNEILKIIDIREPEQFNQYNIGGCLIPFDEVVNRLPDIPTNKPVIFCCELGERSAYIIRYLQKNYGFTNLYNLAGGISGWQISGY